MENWTESLLGMSMFLVHLFCFRCLIIMSGLGLFIESDFSLS